MEYGARGDGKSDDSHVYIYIYICVPLLSLI